MKDLIQIPGDYLEGGGQILRTALSLSVITGRPIRVYNIRAQRPKPGLKAQHFHTIRALKEISAARLEGFFMGSSEIQFFPQQPKSMDLNIDIQTAGSIGLLLQALIPVGIFCASGLNLNIKGGTCGRQAIPVEYYSGIILPTLRSMGVEVRLDLLKRGYYPKGGGEVRVKINRPNRILPLKLVERGRLVSIEGISHAHKELLRQKVSDRQAKQAASILNKRYHCPIRIKTEYSQTFSLGSGLTLWANTDKGVSLGADAIGERGRPSEEVAKQAAAKLITEIDSGAAVDSHLADNLIIYLALGGGRINPSQITLHTQTNIWVTEQFFGKIFRIDGNTIYARKAEIKT